LNLKRPQLSLGWYFPSTPEVQWEFINLKKETSNEGEMWRNVAVHLTPNILLNWLKNSQKKSLETEKKRIKGAIECCKTQKLKWIDEKILTIAFEKTALDSVSSVAWISRKLFELGFWPSLRPSPTDFTRFSNLRPERKARHASGF
jgi:hypothetical protein